MKRRSEKGQSLVEFALVVPLLLLLVIGIAEFARAWMARNVMTGAARETARIAAVNSTPGLAESRGYAVLTAAGITTDRNVAVADDNAAYGTVTATVTYQFPIAVVGFVPGLAGTSITLTSTTTMRKEY